MLGGADNPNGELLSYIIGADILSGNKSCGCCKIPTARKLFTITKLG